MLKTPRNILAIRDGDTDDDGEDGGTFWMMSASKQVNQGLRGDGAAIHHY
jgi:hypothetical protein